jgi:hypothetical protein
VEGTPCWCFIAFLLTSFAKILEGGYIFIPLPHPHPPVPPVCIFEWETIFLHVVAENKRKRNAFDVVWL